MLTGFLGSGKTTLLNQLLKHPSLDDAAVLINEFGEIGIDHQLVETVDESTVFFQRLPLLHHPRRPQAGDHGGFTTSVRAASCRLIDA